VAFFTAVTAITAVVAEVGGDTGEESLLRGLSGGGGCGIITASADEQEKEEEEEEGGGEDQGIFLTWIPEKRISKGLVWKKE